MINKKKKQELACFFFLGYQNLGIIPQITSYTCCNAIWHHPQLV